MSKQSEKRSESSKPISKVKSPLSPLSPVSKDPTIQEDNEPTDSKASEELYDDDFDDEKDLGI